MSKQGYRVKPLMYIVQPEGIDIKANMQSFVVKKTKKNLNLVTEAEEVSEQTHQNEVVVEQEIVTAPVAIEEAIQQVEVEAEEVKIEIKEEIKEQKKEERKQTAKQYRKQKKPISQMSVKEKVEFFKNLPKNMPRTLCLIETIEEKYRGVIITEEDNVVTIRSLTHAKPIELPIQHIKEINLLGF